MYDFSYIFYIIQRERRKNMFKTNLKNYIKDWRFWFKLVLMLLVLFVVLWDFVMSIINPAKEFIYTYTIDKDGVLTESKVVDHIGSLVSYLSFFTIQSNIFVVVWLIIALIFHNREGEHKLLSTKISTLVAVYITVTMMIFNFVLLPQLSLTLDKDNTFNPINWGAFMWFKQMTVHLVGPLSFVIYILCFMKIQDVKPTKQFLKEDSWKSLLYPLVYGIYILLRAEIRIASGMPTTGTSTFPYFFMNLREAWPAFIVVILIIVVLLMGLSTLYNFIIGKRVK